MSGMLLEPVEKGVRPQAGPASTLREYLLSSQTFSWSSTENIIFGLLWYISATAATADAAAIALSLD